MKLVLIVIYLLAWSIVGGAGIVIMPLGIVTPKLEPLRVPLMCCLTALMGSCLYCMRALYFTRCAHKQFDEALQVWYYLRPVAGFICGGISFIFLKSGLLILESNSTPNSSETGFYALALIAGLNVDRFILRIEGVAHAIWGIQNESRPGAAKKDKERGGAPDERLDPGQIDAG